VVGVSLSIGPIRAGLNAVEVSSWGEHDGYISIATPTSEVYGFDCETCAFDIAASGTVGALGESTNLNKFTKGKTWKTLPASQMAVYGVAITPDGVRIAFDAEFWNTPISQQVCLCDTAGTTATSVSLPTGQSAACPVG